MIRILVNDPVAGTKTPAVVPDNVPIRTLLPELIKRIGKPLNNPLGNRIAYMLQKKEVGGGLRQLSENETLARAGVAEDEELILTFRVVMGP